MELWLECNNCVSSLCVVWLGSFGDLFKSQETISIALLVRCVAERAICQADRTQISDSGHNASRAPSGKKGSAKRNGAAETLTMRWCLAAREGCAGRWRRVAPGGMVKSARWWRCSDDATGRWRLAVCDARQAVWTQCPPSDVGCTLGGFGSVMVGEERFLHNFRWCSWCEALARGTVTSVTRIGVTRDHSMLSRGVCPLGSLVECASGGSYGEIRVIALFTAFW